MILSSNFIINKWKEFIIPLTQQWVDYCKVDPDVSLEDYLSVAEEQKKLIKFLNENCTHKR